MEKYVIWKCVNIYKSEEKKKVYSIVFPSKLSSNKKFIENWHIMHENFSTHIDTISVLQKK